jgi:lipoprotein-anchoring transpeptidase ErfK/SrfK
MYRYRSGLSPCGWDPLSLFLGQANRDARREELASPPMRAGRRNHLSRPLRLLAVVLGLALAAGACGGGGGGDDSGGDGDDGGRTTTTAEPAASAPAGAEATPEYVTWVAEAQVDQVEVFDEPDGAEPSHVLDNPNENGAPLVFLVDGRDATGDWLPVHLPVRPNGSTGFVRAGDVRVVQNDFHIKIELGAHRLVVSQRGEPVVEAPIGVGTADTPTPGGVYYIKELLQPPDPNGPYGTHAYGLSGFSNVLESFNGGDGVIGIHGTNDPSSIGQDVSHGCIRVTNDVIDEMAAILPLGTPVEIVD